MVQTHPENDVISGWTNGFFIHVLENPIRGHGRTRGIRSSLFDATRRPFAEVVTSASDMKDFEKAIEYNKKLLGTFLTSRPFLFSSSHRLMCVTIR